MRRKIIKQGAATLTLSLPAKWTKKFNLKAGGEVDVEEQDESLIVKATGERSTYKETLDVTALTLLLKRILVSRYLKGIDELEVKVKDNNQARIVQDRVRDLIGMEIVGQTKNKLILKDLSGTTEQTFDQILRRVFFMLGTVAEESVKAFKKHEVDLTYLADMEGNINRFTDHCLRMLYKCGYHEPSKTPVMYAIIMLLEQLADEYKLLLQYMMENKLSLDNANIMLFERISKLFKQFETLYYDFTIEKAVTMARERDIVIKEIDKQIHKTTSVQESQILRSMREMTNILIRLMGETLTLA